MGSWTCDGRPRNGKYYNGSYPHRPNENNGFNCDVCGLPQEAMQAPATQIIDAVEDNIKTKNYIAIGIIGAIAILLAVGGYFLFFNNNRCETGLEEVAGECIDPYESSYNEGVEMGNNAEKLIANYSNRQELEQAQRHLIDAIAKLRAIPESSPSFAPAAEKINQYENRSRDVAAVIDDFQLCALEPQPDSCRF